MSVYDKMKIAKAYVGGVMNLYHKQNHEDDFLYDAYTADAKQKFSRISLSLLLCIFVTNATAFILNLVLSKFDVYTQLAENVYFQWAISLLPLYFFGIPAAYLCLRRMKVTKPKSTKMELGELLLLFLVGRFLTLLGSQISNALISVTEGFLNREITDTTSELLFQTPWWLIFIAAVIIAPIAEEFVYRKLIIDRLYVHGELVAILFSSVVFSLAHGNFFQVFYAFFNGCILGLIYTRTGRLRYTIAFHMATNFLGSIVVLPLIDVQERLEVLISESNMGAQYLFLSLTITGYSIAKMFVAILGAIILFKSYRKYLPNRRALCPLPNGQGARIAMLNAGFIAFLAISILEFMLSLSI